MSQLLAANNATTTIAGSITSGATTVNLASGTGSLFPNPGAGQYFVGTFNDAATGLLTEIVQVTARSGDTLTIVRAQEGTTAQAWSVNDKFSDLWTAGSMAIFAQLPVVQNGNSNYGVDTGTANAYATTLSPAVGSTPATSGLVVHLKAAHANTGASTLNAGFGAITLVSNAGAALISGQITVGALVTAVYDQPSNQFFAQSILPTSGGTVTQVGLTLPASLFTTGNVVTSSGNVSATFVNAGANTFLGGPTSGSAAVPSVRSIVSADIPFLVPGPGAITGLLPSSIGATSMAISAGAATSSTGSTNIGLPSGASWAVSNGAAVNGIVGGGSLSNSTTYFLFVISGAGETTGVWADTSESAPTLPSGYTNFKRIFAFLTAASGNQIHASYQSANAIETGGGALQLWLSSPTQDVNGSTLGTSSRTLYTTSLPQGIKMQWIGRIWVSLTGGLAIFTSPDEPDQAPANINTAPSTDIAAAGDSQELVFPPILTTNTSAQVGGRGSSAFGFYLYTRGFVDFRRN